MENKCHDGQPCTVKKGNMFSLHMVILLIVHSAWAWSSINIQEKKCHAFSIWMYIWAFLWCCNMLLLCLYFPPMSGEPYHSRSFKISVWSRWLYTESFSFFSQSFPSVYPSLRTFLHNFAENYTQTRSVVQLMSGRLITNFRILMMWLSDVITVIAYVFTDVFWWMEPCFVIV